MPQLNAAGLALIKEFEGCALDAYPDPASPLARTGKGHGDPWTVGYGCTTGVKPKQKVTQAQAEDLLKRDLTKYEDGVAKLVTVELTPNQFAALVSFAYNLGLGALEESTLLRAVNLKNFITAADQFERWVYAGDEIMDGLVRRRTAEKALFLTPG